MVHVNERGNERVDTGVKEESEEMYKLRDLH